MILGMSTSTFTLVHVVLSLVGHFRWTRGPIRHVQLEKARWLDGALSRHWALWPYDGFARRLTRRRLHRSEDVAMVA